MERAEAIKIIKTATVYTPEEMEALETLIPELRESEDEKIRKELIGHCKDLVRMNRDNKVMLSVYEPWLVYLEKQKEASKAIEAVDRIDKYIDEHLANAHDMKDSNPDKKYYRGWGDALGKMSGILQDVYSGEKQKEQKPWKVGANAYFTPEQKPAEWSEEDKEWLSEVYFAIDHSMYSEDERQAMKKYIDSLRSQSKQAEWSEEDEKLLDFWLDVIDSNDWRMDENFCKASREFINKLKSFRPQPKQEWSDTNELVFKDICKHLKEEGYNGWIVLLEALRNGEFQPKWKPSEEQMEALRLSFEDAFNDAGDCNRYRRLKSLYEQLKQL